MINTKISQRALDKTEEALVTDLILAVTNWLYVNQEGVNGYSGTCWATKAGKIFVGQAYKIEGSEFYGHKYKTFDPIQCLQDATLISSEFMRRFPGVVVRIESYYINERESAEISIWSGSDCQAAICFSAETSDNFGLGMCLALATAAEVLAGMGIDDLPSK